MQSSRSRVFNTALWLIHTARDRDRDRDRETMGFYITLCTVHTAQGQGQAYGIIVFYCIHPVPYPGPGPGPVQCVWAINLLFFSATPLCGRPYRLPSKQLTSFLYNVERIMARHAHGRYGMTSRHPSYFVVCSYKLTTNTSALPPVP